MFTQSTPPLLVGTEMSILTMPVQFHRRSLTWNWHYSSRLTSMEADSGDKNNHLVISWRFYQRTRGTQQWIWTVLVMYARSGHCLRINRLKVLSHGHLDAHRIHIRSGSVAFTWMRIDLMCIQCTSDVNPIESTSWGGLDAHSNRIVLLFMIHARLRLPRWDRWLGWLFTRWLGLWHVFIAPFCSALAATLGKK